MVCPCVHVGKILVVGVAGSCSGAGGYGFHLLSSVCGLGSLFMLIFSSLFLPALPH